MKSNYTQLVVKDIKGFVIEAVMNPTVKQVKEYANKYSLLRCYSQGTVIIFDER